jgi:hypothetical protein
MQITYIGYISTKLDKAEILLAWTGAMRARCGVEQTNDHVMQRGF